MNKAELVLAVFGAVLQICLFFLLLRRKTYQQFPIFSVFVGFSALNSIMVLVTGQHPSVYFYVYWISEVVFIALSFLVMQEAFRSVFRNFSSLRWFKLSFPGIGVLILLIALLRAVFFRPPDRNPLAVAFISLEIAVGFLQFGIFCMFVLLVYFFHMRWRHQAFGIVLGFGIAAAGTLVAFILRSEFGTNMNRVFRIATPLSYIIGVAIWLATFLRGEPSQLTRSWDSLLTPEQMISEFKRHTQVVKGILGR